MNAGLIVIILLLVLSIWVFRFILRWVLAHWLP